MRSPIYVALTLDYWVIDLEGNYNYAVIGELDRENLWILSRKPMMEKGILSRIIETTKAMVMTFPI